MKTLTRIDRRFQELRQAGRKGFIAFVTAGDPSLDATVDIVLRLEKAGADIVELGIPFSDPLADGRVNQESAGRALAAGATFDGVIGCVKAIRRKSDVPLLFFSYVNPLLAGGFRNNVRKAARAGVDGFLVLDLPVEESAGAAQDLADFGVNYVCLATPTSSNARIRHIVHTSTGFVYCVSREGVTGMQKRLSKAALELIARTKRLTDLPVALGFGISTPEQARNAAREADAVVVGSAIVDRFARFPRAAAAKWVGAMANAVRSA